MVVAIFAKCSDLSRYNIFIFISKFVDSLSGHKRQLMKFYCCISFECLYKALCLFASEFQLLETSVNLNGTKLTDLGPVNFDFCSSLSKLFSYS